MVHHHMEDHDTNTAVGTDASLHSTTPSEAVQLYLDARRGEASENTLQSHRYRLNHFIRWCEQEGIEDTTQLNGRLLYEYRIWRRNDGDLNVVSVRTQLATLRAFVRFLETIEAARDDLHEKIVLPSLENGEGTRDAIVTAERASEILSYYHKYEYASMDHALFTVLWHCGCRIGEAYAMDVSDFHPRKASLEIKHRPRGGTPLKHKGNGERPVALSKTVVETLKDYISTNRHTVEDDSGRKPLFSSKQGRCSKTTLRRAVYRTTQPCLYGPCPHDRDPEDCDARVYDKGDKCPSTRRPHDIRRSAITHFLNSDVPKEVVSDRMDVKGDALSRHYDRRTADEKMELRREYLTNVD